MSACLKMKIRAVFPAIASLMIFSTMIYVSWAVGAAVKSGVFPLYPCAIYTALVAVIFIAHRFIYREDCCR